MNISSPKDLNKIIEKINKIISPGDYIFLFGEIGSGKTNLPPFKIKLFSCLITSDLKDHIKTKRYLGFNLRIFSLDIIFIFDPAV